MRFGGFGGKLFSGNLFFFVFVLFVCGAVMSGEDEDELIWWWGLARAETRRKFRVGGAWCTRVYICFKFFLLSWWRLSFRLSSHRPMFQKTPPSLLSFTIFFPFFIVFFGKHKFR